jgi:hypothetical protein
MDKAAVEEFSEFSFDKNFFSRSFKFRRGGNIIGIKIIKPSGEEIEIDIDEEAVENDNEKKLAIANLEVGDILDFFYYRQSNFKSKIQYGFSPVERTIGEQYPVLDFKIRFETENDFFVNFQSYNGAPKLKQLPNDERNLRQYELVAQDIEKNEFPLWFYPLVELPSYKFQVYFARSGKFEKRADAFLSEKEDVIKTAASMDDVYRLYSEDFSTSLDIKDFKKYIKGKQITAPEKIVEEAYYFVRHHSQNKNLEPFYTNASFPASRDLLRLIKSSSYSYYYTISNIIFLSKIITVLKAYNIDHSVLVGTARYNGPIADLLLTQNTDIFIKINLPEPLFISNIDLHSQLGKVSPFLEGTTLYEISYDSKKRPTRIANYSFPVSHYRDNKSLTKIDLNFDDEITEVTFRSRNELTGHMKKNSQNNIIHYYDYLYEELDAYNSEPIINTFKNKRKKATKQKEMDAVMTESKKLQLEEMKSSVASDLNLTVDDYDYEIIEQARFNYKTPFIYEETFTVKEDLITRAGSNYIFDIGKIIGGQITLEEKEKQRDGNIYMSFPRTIRSEITLNIPDGFSVSGIDQLNTTIENKTGGFVSKAAMEGNVLKISTHKTYKNNYESAEDWPKMVSFLESAYDFTQAKILLKKQ